MARTAWTYGDAVGFLVRYLVRNAMGMATNSVRPSNQPSPTGGQDAEFATVHIISDDGDINHATRRTANYTYPVWSATTAYTIGTKVTRSSAAYVCTTAVTGGTGPGVDTAHWAATAQSTGVQETLDVYHEFTASVQFFRHADPSPDAAGVVPFGLGAFDKASRLQSVLMLSTNMEIMQRLGLMLLGASQARDLSRHG